jgi:YVTN family beta-propeller protein
MRRTLALAVAGTALAACHLPARAPGALPRLAAEEGEAWIYVQPLGEEASGLSVSLASIAAVRADGAEVPLTLRLTRLAPSDPPSQHLLAWGRLPPGAYDGLKVSVSRATLAGGEGASDLLAPKEPAAVPAPFTVAPGKAAVVGVELRAAESVRKRYAFAPAFSAFVPERPVPQLAALCSNAGGASVTVLDRQRLRAGAVLPTGGAPRGIALDVRLGRAWVAVAAEDAIDVFDVATGEALAPVRLQPGDRPAEVALSPDGRTLVVTNEGSSTVAFLDVRSQTELGRVPAGDAPRALLLDPGGQRAYALGQRSNDVTVVDVPNRVVVARVPTDPEPLRAAVSRDGSRLYVVAAGSAYLTVLSLPALEIAGRVFVGLGARTVLVDARTDLVYVAGDLGGRIQIFDPVSLVPVDALDLPGEVGWLAIADAENALFALLADRRQIAVLDLSGREALGVVDVGDAPYQIVLAGQRR